jgi:hypothetical protein
VQLLNRGGAAHDGEDMNRVKEARVPGEDRTNAVLGMNVVIALTFCVGSMLVGLLLVGHFFTLPSIHPDYTGVPTPANFIGVLLIFFIFPIGMVRGRGGREGF